MATLCDLNGPRIEPRPAVLIVTSLTPTGGVSEILGVNLDQRRCSFYANKDAEKMQINKTLNNTVVCTPNMEQQ